VRPRKPERGAHAPWRLAGWGVASRLLAGGVGGYALAQVLPVSWVAVVAPALHRADAVLVAMQLSFVVYALAFMGAFAARSARRAWAGVLMATLCSAAIAWMAL